MAFLLEIRCRRCRLEGRDTIKGDASSFRTEAYIDFFLNLSNRRSVSVSEESDKFARSDKNVWCLVFVSTTSRLVKM